MAERAGSKIDFIFGIRGRRRLLQLDLMLDEVLLCIFPARERRAAGTWLALSVG
jgi:hypothetical protein